MFGKKKRTRPHRQKMRCPCSMAVWIAVVSVLVLQLVIFCMVGGYADAFHLLRGYVPLPPLWLFTTLDWFCCALGGAVLGRILFLGRLYEGKRFRSAFFTVLALTLGYFWYALFFGAHAFLLSLLFAALAFLVALSVLFCLGREGRGLSYVFIWAGYAFYRLLLSLFCLFSL